MPTIEVLQDKEEIREAKGYLGTMQSLMRSYMDHQDKNNYKEAEEVLQEIYQFPLQFIVNRYEEAGSYMMLLGTGGPAVRLIGSYMPDGRWHHILQHQDWFTPWRDIGLTRNELTIVNNFVSLYMGE